MLAGEVFNVRTHYQLLGKLVDLDPDVAERAA